MYFARTLEQAVARASAYFPVILVTGPRQSGKTTLLRHLGGEERGYVSLDDPDLRNLAREDPRLLLQRFPPPVTIDEIQYAPEILPLIKIAVDGGSAPGSFWLTGSQQFPVMKGITETLAGRVAVLNLLGFSRREGARLPSASPFLPGPERLVQSAPQESLLDAPSLARLMWQGSLPRLIATPDIDHDLFIASYVQTYLQRDVRDLVQVNDLDRFSRFLGACAARTGNLLNLSVLARDVDVSVPTAKRWLSVLVASFQIHLLPPYHTNVTKRIVKTPKLYFLDTGLCAWLTGWRSPETLIGGAMAGPLFETWVVSEILKSWWHCGREPPLYFYRDRDGHEIDLLFDLDGRLHPVEIKLAATSRRSWTQSISPLARLDKPTGDGAILCLVPGTLPLTESLTAINAAAV